MEFIQTEWSVNVHYCKVSIIGTSPFSNGFVGLLIQKAMVTKAVELIEKAQNMANCVILSVAPNNERALDGNKIEIYFSILFENPDMANKYASSLNK